MNKSSIEKSLSDPLGKGKEMPSSTFRKAKFQFYSKNLEAQLCWKAESMNAHNFQQPSCPESFSVRGGGKRLPMCHDSTEVSQAVRICPITSRCGVKAKPGRYQWSGHNSTLGRPQRRSLSSLILWPKANKVLKCAVKSIKLLTCSKLSMTEYFAGLQPYSIMWNLTVTI